VRAALVDLELRILDEFHRLQGGRLNRHYLIVVAMQNKRRHVESREVLGQIRLGEGLDAEIGGRHAGEHALQPKGLAHALGHFRARPIIAVEGQAEILEQL
jgi:hypothetical protein